MPAVTRVTEEDLERLDRLGVDRAARPTRTAGTVLVVIGAVALAGWAWVAIRAQQHLGRVAVTFGEPASSTSAGLVERLDAFFAVGTWLSLAGVALGLGFLLRLAAAYAQARAGEGVSGLRVGDALPPDDEDPYDDELTPSSEPRP